MSYLIIGIFVVVYYVLFAGLLITVMCHETK